MKVGDKVRIVWGGTVTSGGIILKKGVRRYKIRHHHGREEWIPKENVREVLS